MIEHNVMDLYNNIELPLSKVLAKMELNGISVDTKILEDMKTEIKKQIDIVTEEIYKQSGVEFNISSPKQLGEVLDRPGAHGLAVQTLLQAHVHGEHIGQHCHHRQEGQHHQHAQEEQQQQVGRLGEESTQAVQQRLPQGGIGMWLSHRFQSRLLQQYF